MSVQRLWYWGCNSGKELTCLSLRSIVLYVIFYFHIILLPLDWLDSNSMLAHFLLKLDPRVVAITWYTHTQTGECIPLCKPVLLNSLSHLAVLVTERRSGLTSEGWQVPGLSLFISNIQKYIALHNIGPQVSSYTSWYHSIYSYYLPHS